GFEVTNPKGMHVPDRLLEGHRERGRVGLEYWVCRHGLDGDRGLEYRLVGQDLRAEAAGRHERTEGDGVDVLADGEPASGRELHREVCGAVLEPRAWREADLRASAPTAPFA